VVSGLLIIHSLLRFIYCHFKVTTLVKALAISRLGYRSIPEQSGNTFAPIEERLHYLLRISLPAFRKVLQLTDNPSKSDLPPKPTHGSDSRSKKGEKNSSSPAQVASIHQALIRMNLQSKAEARSAKRSHQRNYAKYFLLLKSFKLW